MPSGKSDLFELIQGYCHAAVREIPTHVFDKIVLDVESAKQDYNCFKRGLDALRKIQQAWHTDEDARSQAFTEAGNLKVQLLDAGTALGGHAVLNQRLGSFLKFFDLFKQVMREMGQPEEIVHIWEKVYSHSQTIHTTLEPLKKGCDDLHTKFDFEKARLTGLELEVRIRHGNYSEEDVRQLASIAFKLRQIRMVEAEYREFLASNRNGATIEKAKAGMRKSFGEVTSIRDRIEQSRKAKADEHSKAGKKQEDKKHSGHRRWRLR